MKMCKMDEVEFLAFSELSKGRVEAIVRRMEDLMPREAVYRDDALS